VPLLLLLSPTRHRHIRMNHECITRRQHVKPRPAARVSAPTACTASACQRTCLPANDPPQHCPPLCLGPVGGVGVSAAVSTPGNPNSE
jgi:hypothetical protein